MADEHTFPLGILRILMLITFGFGLAVYLIFSALFMWPEYRFFDIGLFSFSIIFVLFGLVGYWVATMEQKKRDEEASVE